MQTFASLHEQILWRHSSAIVMKGEVFYTTLSEYAKAEGEVMVDPALQLSYLPKVLYI